MAKTMKMTFYPVGCGDTTLVEDDSGKHFLIDYNCPDQSEADDDDRIYLPDELNEKLRGKKLDVLMITHCHDDHYCGFSKYFWLNFANEYQGDDRKKMEELWVPDCIIWETGLKGEARTLRSEARYRLLDERKGIKVIGDSDSLKNFIDNSGRAKYDDVKHLIYKPGGIIKHFNGFEIFVHSPHSWVTENDENKNNKCIVIQADFFIDAQSVTKAIFGGDAESDAWENIYSSSKNNNNLSKLEHDVFGLSHHCSYTALDKDEKGDLITEPVDSVKKIFEQQGRNGCQLIASCDPIPSREKRNETGPPHYQAAEYYRKIKRQKEGEFKVTMEQPKGARHRNAIVIEVTKYGPRLLHSTVASVGASRITQTRSERYGA